MEFLQSVVSKIVEVAVAAWTFIKGLFTGAKDAAEEAAEAVVVSADAAAEIASDDVIKETVTEIVADVTTVTEGMGGLDTATA